MNQLFLVIEKLGDKTTSEHQIESQIERLSGSLLNDLDDYYQYILKCIMKCALNLALKPQYYASLIALICLQRPKFGYDIITETKKEFLEGIKQGEWMKVKLTLRFICELTNYYVLGSDYLILIFKSLLKYLSNSKYIFTLKDTICYIIIANLPWCGRVLNIEKQEDLNSIIESLSNYMNYRKMNTLKSFSFQKDDFLSMMWKQLLTLQKSTWKVQSLIKPNFENCSKIQYQLNDQFKQFTLDDFDVLLKPIQKNRIGLKLDEDEKKKPIDYFLIEEYINDVVYFYNPFGHMEATKALNFIPYRYGYLESLIDTLFSNILQINLQFPLIYYNLIIIDLSENPKFVSLLIDYIDNLFVLLDEMDIEIYDRFCDFLAFILNHFNLKWIWGNWVHILSKTETIQYQFLKDLFEELLRYVSFDKLKGEIPNEFYPLLPNEPIPISLELSNDQKVIIEQLTHLQDLKGSNNMYDLIYSFLYSSKSISHFMNLLSKYHKVFENQNEEMIKGIFNYWKNNHQMIEISIEKCLEYKIISPESLYQYIFSLKDLSSKWIWCIIYNTLKKETNSLEIFTKKISHLLNYHNITNRCIPILRKNRYEFLQLKSIPKEFDELLK